MVDSIYRLAHSLAFGLVGGYQNCKINNSCFCPRNVVEDVIDVVQLRQIILCGIEGWIDIAKGVKSENEYKIDHDRKNNNSGHLVFEDFLAFQPDGNEGHSQASNARGFCDSHGSQSFFPISWNIAGVGEFKRVCHPQRVPEANCTEDEKIDGIPKLVAS